MDQQSPKQRVAELLRNAESVVVTVSSSPDTDSMAGAIALGLMLEKLGKKTSVIISSLPGNLDFLPQNVVKKEPAVSRDFIIEVDTSKTEADKLKYTQEGKKLKIYLTPYEGNFSREDVAFEYGEYHNEVVVLLGGSGRSDLDPSIAKHKQLLGNTKLVTIHHEERPEEDRIIAWHENTSSICEMLMSISEALGSGLLDEQIATPLLTGIIAKTNHFTGPNTSPKVMTMAAQLMAAGANQSTIIDNLNRREPTTVSPDSPKTDIAEAEQNLPERKEESQEVSSHSNITKPEPPKDWKPFNIPEPNKQPQINTEVNKPSQPTVEPAHQAIATPGAPNTAPTDLAPERPQIHPQPSVQQPSTTSQEQNTQNAPAPNSNSPDDRVEAARRAVEAAMSQHQPAETNIQQRFENPPAPSIDSGQSQQLPQQNQTSPQNLNPQSGPYPQQ